MSDKNLICEYASSHDSIAISDVLREAAQWMARYKRPLWEPDMFDVAYAQSYIERREFLVAKRDRGIVGVTILQWNDTEFWPDYDDDNAGYIHKLAVRRLHAGCGVAEALIKEAGEKARSKKRNYLRLDCDLELCPVYNRLGFSKIDEVKISPSSKESFIVARYQKDLS